ncbi:hypothetical protein LJR015_003029 [Peribacillus frigoritolerans]|uniref:hypothetical protein n=1 Tax=Peribacillus TaxID=2675229 RepID=UPI0026AE0A3F|nr:hypothetical protein [Peribacillus simplex]
MNILIAGAHGTTGKQIIGELSKNPQMNVYGMIRKEEQANDKRTRRASNPCRFRGKCG